MQKRLINELQPEVLLMKSLETKCFTNTELQTF